jgi:tRNA modification GTPase
MQPNPTDYSSDDTIVAWAGGSVPAALGIVRLSGPRAHAIAGAMTRRAPDPAAWRGRDPQAFYTRIYKHQNASGEPASDYSQYGELIDECIAVWYRAPFSYTGEDMVELSIHGNPLLARELINAYIAHGAREAAPGEFTARAFLNGRLDLTQAEAVQELIAARSASRVALARNMLAGALRTAVDAWYARLVRVRAELEVVFDYPGDSSDASFAHEHSTDGSRAAALAPYSDEAQREHLREILHEIAAEMRDRLAFDDRGRAFREGARVIIAGAPNVGKSSLFNAITGFERALTDVEPGTTRDYLEITLDWEKLSLTLVDTAGLRDSPDRVEAMGVARAAEVIADADVVLYVVDASEMCGGDIARHFDNSAAAFENAGLLRLSERSTLVYVFNKTDLLAPDETATLDALVQGIAKRAVPHRAGSVSPIGARAANATFVASAKSGAGIAALRAWLLDALTQTDTSDRVILTERHRTLIELALAALETADNSLRQGVPTDLVVMDVADAMKALAAVTGRAVMPDVLDEIFGSFCIGK